MKNKKWNLFRFDKDGDLQVLTRYMDRLDVATFTGEDEIYFLKKTVSEDAATISFDPFSTYPDTKESLAAEMDACRFRAMGMVSENNNRAVNGESPMHGADVFAKISDELSAIAQKMRKCSASKVSSTLSKEQYAEAMETLLSSTINIGIDP